MENGRKGEREKRREGEEGGREKERERKGEREKRREREKEREIYVDKKRIKIIHFISLFHRPLLSLTYLLFSSLIVSLDSVRSFTSA